MPEQSFQQTPEMQDAPDRNMQNNGEHNSVGPMGERPLLHHPSQDMPHSDIPRKGLSPTALTNHASINGQNRYRNPPTQRPPSTHSPNQNNPVRARHRELVQVTANPQTARNDYGQISSMSQETMCQNKYASLYENYGQQGYSNSVNAKCQPQEAQMAAQLQEPHLPSYDRDGPRNEGSNLIYINGYRVKKNVDFDSRSTLSSPETSRSKVRGLKTKNFEGLDVYVH